MDDSNQHTGQVIFTSSYLEVRSMSTKAIHVFCIMTSAQGHTAEVILVLGEGPFNDHYQLKCV